MIHLTKKIIYFFLCTLIFLSCSKESSEDTPQSTGPLDNLDNITTNEMTWENDMDFRKDLLKNLVDNIILPSYNDFSNKLSAMNNSLIDFSNNVTQDNLDQLRSDWLKCYKSWQHIEMYDIAKAEQIYYRLRMNAYPCNSTIINQNINNEVTDISTSNYSNYTSQGFPALDYMLYGLDQDSTIILDFYTDPINGFKYINYLTVIINNMVLNTEMVISDWQINRSSFINSTTNTATSSLNMLTNDFIFYYEKGFRANKIGIPAGVFSPAALPFNVEAYHKKNISKTLALEALSAIEKFFKGQSYDLSTDGLGLDTYVNFLDNDLDDLILSKFNNANNKILLLNDNFVTQINQDKLQMLICYDAIQEAVVLLKTDMLQNLNINVDYIDADGD